MRTLTPTLLAAQQSPAATPYLKVQVSNKVCGVVRSDWQRLYTGAEPDGFHAAAMPGDGSLLRFRVTPIADGSKLYRQRVVDPGVGADFSNWPYFDCYNIRAVCTCSRGSEVTLFFARGDRALLWMRSLDNGATWSAPEILTYTPTGAAGGMAAAYKSGGDLALFFADGSTVYAAKYVSGTWQEPVAWTNSTGVLSSVTVVYDGDWNLLVTGVDGAGNPRLWSLVYGDGAAVPAGNWSSLTELAAAPAGGDFEYKQAFLDNAGVYRACYVEKFAGNESYSRPFWSHTAVSSSYIEGLWREPVPFDVSSECGLTPVHNEDYLWLCTPSGVWRALLAEQNLDVSEDVFSVKEELAAGKTGCITVVLRNDDGRYASPGSGALVALQIGCRIEVSPGYRTAAGLESSPGDAFILENLEHVSAGGKASLILYGSDARSRLEKWLPRQQFRWNATGNNACVKEIMAQLLARAGIRLETISASETLTSFYPDFTVNPGTHGSDALDRLLALVPDIMFFEGDTAYLLNPQAVDSAGYSYGLSHAIGEGAYRHGLPGLNRIEIEGAADLVYQAFRWDELHSQADSLRRITDTNIDTVAKAQERADALFRGAEIKAVSGIVRVPVNCGQQLYDVIEISDTRAGFAGASRRVLGIRLSYQPAKAQYEHWLTLGAV